MRASRTPVLYGDVGWLCAVREKARLWGEAGSIRRAGSGKEHGREMPRTRGQMTQQVSADPVILPTQCPVELPRDGG